MLDGGDGNDSLNGGGGNDTLYGGAGYDTLEGGAGNDILDGGSEGKGGDTAQYATAGSAVVVNLSTNTATGGAGNDTLISMENITGSSFADTLTGDANSNRLNGGEGNDMLSGGDGSDSLYGDAGSDTLSDGAGDDYLDDSSWTLDRIADNNTLDGGSGNDTFYVYSAKTIDSSVLTGGAGADRFYLDPYNFGALTITDFTVGSGGDIIDIYNLIYSNSGYGSGNPFDPAQGYLRLVQSGADTRLQWDRDGAAAEDDGWQTVLTLQNINFFATPLMLENFSPRVPVDGNNTGLTLTGDAGDNYLEGTLVDDTLYGYAGNDHLDGGDDDDSLYGDLGSDMLLGGAGSDYLVGGKGDDTLYGDDGNDWLYGDSGNDLLIGGEGDDYLDGGMEGKSGTGSDTAGYSTAASAVVVNLSLGMATGGAGDDSLTGIENILGSLHADMLTGDANPNVLDGNAGADSLKGESGDDSYVVDDAVIPSQKNSIRVSIMSVAV
jgi:Ca2+-binding RTX toxin-like protein